VSRRGPESAEAVHIEGEDAALTGSIDRAAAILCTARRVLVTGMTDAAIDAVRAACDIAESLGAAIDACDRDLAWPLGPVVVRAGGVTADPAELGDRADLVILWFCNPEGLASPVADAWQQPLRSATTPRTVIAVGPEPVAWAGRHLALPAETAVDAARLLHAILLGNKVPPENPTAARLSSPCQELATAIHAASCVAVVTGIANDSSGLATWAVSLLVRSIAHRRPAFVVPLDYSADAAAVLTWRYGAAGAIARADRLGGEFRPAECSSRALVARGEVDAVLAVGSLPRGIEDAIAQAGNLAVVRVEPSIPVLVALRDRIAAREGS
jgi:formylmethanofuran dehydrogenase subunit B